MLENTYHQPSQTSGIGEIGLLLECIIVIIADPLITCPVDPFDTRSFIPGGRQIILGDDILDLL